MRANPARAGLEMEVIASGLNLPESRALEQAGTAIGTALGTVFPGAGNVIGAVAGFAIGVAIYAVTDLITVKGNSARGWLKEGLNRLW